jgi:hypothetical protein
MKRQPEREGPDAGKLTGRDAGRQAGWLEGMQAEPVHYLQCFLLYNCAFVCMQCRGMI